LFGGKATGIKREDLTGPQGITYQGERATIVDVRDSGSEVELLLGFGDREILLSGYFDGDEFMELNSRLRLQP
jgi:hypothetical protein